MLEKVAPFSKLFMELLQILLDKTKLIPQLYYCPVSWCSTIWTCLLMLIGFLVQPWKPLRYVCRCFPRPPWCFHGFFFLFICLISKIFYQVPHSRPENLENSRQKYSWNQINNFFLWNSIIGNLKCFPSSKIDFWPFFNFQKMEFGKKKFMKLILWFHEFFGLDFFKFSGLLWNN